MDDERRPTEVAGAGPALFQLVRFWSRRWITRTLEGASSVVDDHQVRDVLVLEAVHAAAAQTDEVSVADVAHQLGIDRSGASRVISEAIAHGHLERTTSPTDARRAALAVTDTGRTLLAESHAWQEDAFAALTHEWDPDDAARLARYLRRLAAELPGH